jgi:hypothetical protein
MFMFQGLQHGQLRAESIWSEREIFPKLLCTGDGPSLPRPDVYSAARKNIVVKIY